MPRITPMIFIHSSDELYGADRMLLEMIGSLDAEMPCEVWVPRDLAHPTIALCHELERRGVPVRHLDLPILRRAYLNPRGIAGLLGRAGRLLRELRAVRASAVYCTTSAAFLAAPLARIARTPRVLGHVQEIWSRQDRYLLGVPARACHSLLTISAAVSDSLPAALRRRAVVVPNATPEPERVVPLGEHAGPLRFLVASRWNGWKGHRTLLRAWDRAGAPGQLVVLGGRPPSGDAVDVESIVASLRRPETISIVGEVADPSSYVDAADVVLMPSDRPEPFGLVAIEAFARGRPVIGSDAGGLRDIVTAGSDGWLFPPGDSDSLAAVLSGLTREAVTLAGAQARETYETRYTAARFGQEWRAAIAGVGKRPGDGRLPG